MIIFLTETKSHWAAPSVLPLCLGVPREQFRGIYCSPCIPTTYRAWISTARWSSALTIQHSLSLGHVYKTSRHYWLLIYMLWAAQCQWI